MTMPDRRVRDAVHKRSGGRCEAEYEMGGRWRRCRKRAGEVHHLLTKARGGRHLDRMGETAHLLHLCHEHHRQAHEETGHDLIISGEVEWDRLTKRPVYRGDDHELRQRWGAERR